ncbi:hypothetical protein [Ktedonobacter robiniae]|nr:hypothetical protein [Ktedonobacter robiniae]
MQEQPPISPLEPPIGESVTSSWAIAAWRTRLWPRRGSRVRQ